MVFYEHSQETLRSQVFDSAIKQIAQYAYKMKPLVSVVSTGAWKNYFFREQTATLSGKTGNATKGIPRGAEFPQATLSWERVMTTIEKYGLEDTIPYEDIISNEIDVRDRTLQRIAEGVAKAVDTEIFDSLSEDLTATNIQSMAVTAGKWAQSSAAIMKDITTGKKMIKDYYDNASDFVLVINPTAEISIMNYVYEKGAQAPMMAGDTLLNGNIGKLGGVNIITAAVCPTSYALLVVPKRCATWKELMPLATDVQERRFKDTKITACEMGVTQLTDPKSVVLIGPIE